MDCEAERSRCSPALASTSFASSSGTSDHSCETFRVRARTSESKCEVLIQRVQTASPQFPKEKSMKFRTLSLSVVVCLCAASMAMEDWPPWRGTDWSEVTKEHVL